MSEKRFDEEIGEQAVTAIKELLKHPELGSVTLVFGWDLPTQAAAGLPSGVWIPKDDTMSFQRAITMQEQLLRLQGNAVQAVRRLLDMAALQAKKASEGTPIEDLQQEGVDKPAPSK